MENTTVPTVRLHVSSSIISPAVEQYVRSICKKCGNFRELSRGFIKEGERFQLTIKFENASSSTRARELLHNSNVPGFPSIPQLRATYAEMTKNLWIGNLHRNVTERMLLDDCERNVGVVPESIRIIQSARKFAFMSFRSMEDAKCALLGLQGLVLPPGFGWALAVDFDSRNEKQDGTERNLPPIRNINTNNREETEDDYRKRVYNERILQRSSYSPPQPERREILFRDGNSNIQIKRRVTASPIISNPRKSDSPMHQRSPNIIDLPNLRSKRSRSPECTKPSYSRSPEPTKRYSSSDKSLQPRISPHSPARNSTSKSPLSSSHSPEPIKDSSSPTNFSAQRRCSPSPKSPEIRSRSSLSSLSSKSNSPSSRSSISKSPSSSEDNKRSRQRSRSPKRSNSSSSKRYRPSIDSEKQFIESMDSMLKAIEKLAEKVHSNTVTPPNTPITPKHKFSSKTVNTESLEKQISCPECTRITVLFRQHIESSHTSFEDDVIKDWIKLWFTSRFERATESDPAISTVSYTKLKFLKEELNVFLRSINVEEWNSSTPLYRNWFLPNVLGEKLEGAKLKTLVFRIKISNEEAKQHVLNSIS